MKLIRALTALAWFFAGLVLGSTILSVCGCACPRDRDRDAALVDAQLVDVDASEQLAERAHCDPCERVAVCCAPAWGPGCAAVLLDVDGTLTRCRASFAAQPCNTACVAPESVPCETIRAGAVRWCE